MLILLQHAGSTRAVALRQKTTARSTVTIHSRARRACWALRSIPHINQARPARGHAQQVRRSPSDGVAQPKATAPPSRGKVRHGAAGIRVCCTCPSLQIHALRFQCHDPASHRFLLPIRFRQRQRMRARYLLSSRISRALALPGRDLQCSTAAKVGDRLHSLRGWLRLQAREHRADSVQPGLLHGRPTPGRVPFVRVRYLPTGGGAERLHRVRDRCILRRHAELHMPREHIQ